MDKTALITMALKYAAGGVLMGMLFALAWSGKYAENAPFVTLATTTLGALVGHLATTPGTKPAAPPQA